MGAITSYLTISIGGPGSPPMAVLVKQQVIYCLIWAWAIEHEHEHGQGHGHGHGLWAWAMIILYCLRHFFFSSSGDVLSPGSTHSKVVFHDLGYWWNTDLPDSSLGGNETIWSSGGIKSGIVMTRRKRLEVQRSRVMTWHSNTRYRRRKRWKAKYTVMIACFPT